MTTKAKQGAVSLKANKAAAKAPSAPAITLTDDGALSLAVGIAAAVKSYEKSLTEVTSLMDKINADCKTLRAAKRTLGKSRRTCALSQAIYTQLKADGYADGTANNILSAIRACVNEGKRFDLNANRKAKAKGESTGNIMVAIAAGDDGAKAAAKFLKAFNKMKESDNDELASLAAFLIDAVDAAGYLEEVDTDAAE